MVLLNPKIRENIKLNMVLLNPKRENRNYPKVAYLATACLEAEALGHRHCKPVSPPAAEKPERHRSKAVLPIARCSLSSMIWPPGGFRLLGGTLLGSLLISGDPTTWGPVKGSLIFVNSRLAPAKALGTETGCCCGSARGGQCGS